MMDLFFFFFWNCEDSVRFYIPSPPFFFFFLATYWLLVLVLIFFPWVGGGLFCLVVLFGPFGLVLCFGVLMIRRLAEWGKYTVYIYTLYITTCTLPDSTLPLPITLCCALRDPGLVEVSSDMVWWQYHWHASLKFQRLGFLSFLSMVGTFTAVSPTLSHIDRIKCNESK